MSFDLSGKVIEVGPVQQKGESFKKREFVIEVSESGSAGREFINYVKFQCIQDRTDIIDESYLNDNVKVSFNIKGNKWERDGQVNYFTNLDAWRIEKASVGSTAPDDDLPPPLLDDMPPENEEMDDLPF
ncbi:MAG: DUF3127 domain-containing protein [Bacteroidales bacterium]|nr:DUF3127 domain-containing protein [Bacteroidales bacterium]